MKRRLSAILFYDVVGYSRSMHENEGATIEAIKVNRKTIIDPQAELHNGRTIQVLGDGGFMEFASAVDATRFAIAMQTAVAERNLGLPEEQRLVFRIGINIGDVGVDGDLIYGDGVNIAARLETLAQPGGISVHQTVHDQVLGKLDLDYDDLGEKSLKNIEEPVRVYHIILNDKAASVLSKPGERLSGRRQRSRVWSIAVGIAAIFAFLITALWWQPWTPRIELASVERMVLPLPDKPSLAVLPFANMSDDNAQQHFADGMTEDLITDLSRISGLFVIARNSTFVYKGMSVSIPKVAEDLGVRYVLEGSVRRSGDQVRVNAQLIDATTGGHIWADRYDGDVSDIFTIQDEFVRKIVKSLAINLTEEEQEEIAQGQTSNIKARAVFQEGWESYLRYSADDNAAAVDFFKKALELDPEYGRAHAAIGMAYLRGCQLRWHEPLGMSIGAANVKATQSLDEMKTRPSSLANVAASRINLYNSRYEIAQTEATRAIVKDPNDPEAYIAKAWAMITTGQPEVGLELVDRATRLNPTHPSYYILARGMAYFAMDDLEKASDVFSEALERDRGATELAAVLASIYAQLGEYEKAGTTLQLWKPEASPRELQRAVYKYHFPYGWSGQPEILDRLIEGLYIAALPPEDQIPSLANALKHEEKFERVRAAQLLGRYGQRAGTAVPSLIAALTDDVMTVRKEAIIALGNIGPEAKAAIPALTTMVDKRIVGYRAKEAISKISGE